MVARDIMTPDPATVSAQASLGEAAAMLRELDIRHLPVIRNGALVGILSDRDLGAVDVVDVTSDADLDAVRARLAQPVTAVMSPDVISVDPEAELADVVALMIETKVGAVPVVDESTREVLGIISYIDVLRAVQDLLES